MRKTPPPKRWRSWDIYPPFSIPHWLRVASGDMNFQAFPGCPACGLNKFSQPLEEATKKKSKSWRDHWGRKLSVPVNSELGWGAMRRGIHSICYHGNLANSISRYNQGKSKADLSSLPHPPQILLYFTMGWTPGKINIFFPSLLPPFSFLGWARQTSGYQDGERRGCSLRVSQRLDGLWALEREDVHSTLDRCHLQPHQ